MELKDTVDMMYSDDYRERFVAEYLQNKIRYDKLRKFYARASVDSSVEHDCPLELLKEQLDVMDSYLMILEKRAIIENIEL